jgi:hypothetical protein
LLFPSISDEGEKTVLNLDNRKMKQSVEAIFNGINLPATDHAKFWGEIKVCNKFEFPSFPLIRLN